MTEIAPQNPSSHLNTMALIGFILSLSAIVFGVTAIPGVVLGHIGLSQIKKTGEQGKGLGISALAVGYAIIGFTVIGIIIFVVLLIIFGSVYGDGANDMFVNSGGAI